MLERASGQFEIDGQVEDILGGTNGAARIARISQSCRFSGQLEGESMAEFTAVLPRESDGSFHGFQRVAGRLGEREGTFVLSVTGNYVKGQPRGSWSIVPKSGSGDFTHIRGNGTFSLPDGKPGKYQLEFDLRKPRAAKTAVRADVPTEPEVAPGIADDLINEAAAIIETIVPATPKPIRKPRKRVVETPTEPVAKIAPKPTRTRKRVSEPVAPDVAAETTPKRARARRAVEDIAPAAAFVDSAPEPKRSRKPVAVAVEADPSPVPVPSEAKAKRARKASAAEPAVEPVVSIAEPAPAKPARRKKTPPPAPVVLPVAEPATSRKRRANAA